MSIAIAILGLALLIFIHEAGHFGAALAVGMRPRGFSIGFGPALAKVRRNDIDYAFRVVPLGGYVTIPGMTRPQPSDVDAFLGGAIRDVPELVGPAERLKRALDARDFEQARRELDAFEAVAAAREANGIRRGVRHIGDSLSADAYWRQPIWKRVVTIAAGPATNLAFAVVVFAIVLMAAGGKATTKVEDVFEDRPAAAIGLQPGDRILEIDGVRVTPERITELISGSEGRPLTVVVMRDGERVRLGPVRPRLDDDDVYRLGFRLGAEPLGTGESFQESVILTARLTGEIVKSLGNIVHEEGREQIASPIGIVDESSSAARQGWESYLAVLAFISLSLGLLNLLPLLPLDGGHIVFAVAEKVGRRPIRREIYERVSAVGIAVVLLLFFIGLSNDIGGRSGG
ncbi:MAG TPA: M50 family metallopeptidase [Gaiellaceae bacterium]|nr:M50 family metallopeptidase [Gaiellaceae bacterium]